jgi:hypothetical protein
VTNTNTPGSLWWDNLLDGNPHEIDLRQERRFKNLSTFRASVYREAEGRHLGVKTHKVSPFQLWVQATGVEERNRYFGPPEVKLRNAVPVPIEEDNPYTIRLDPDNDHAPCTCGSVGQFHTISCAAVTDQ